MIHNILVIMTFLFVVACTKENETIGSKKEMEKPALSDEIVASYDGNSISNRELEEFLKPELLQLRHEEYKIKSTGIRKMLFTILQEKEAKKAGITTEEFYKQNIINKAEKPGEDEINRTLDQYRLRLPKDENKARNRVVDYLKMQKIQKREELFREELFAKTNVKIMLEPPREDIPIDENDLVRGSKEAVVTIIEFTDFECPYCAKIQSTLNKLMKDYEGKIKLVFKQLPLDFHKNAKFAAEASLCANDQGKFWELHDWFFVNQRNLGNFEMLKKHAAKLEMDVDAFTACINEKKYAKNIEEDLALAQKYGASATPTFFINGRLLQGAQPYDKFKEIIDEELDFAAKKSIKKQLK